MSRALESALSAVEQELEPDHPRDFQCDVCGNHFPEDEMFDDITCANCWEEIEEEHNDFD